MKKSDDIQEIAKALANAQKEIKPAAEDSVNPHFKSRYANLEAVWDAIRSPLGTNGLSILQDIATEDKRVLVTTTIIHISGQWIEFGPLGIPLTKTDAHGVGSAITYGKRYALCAAMGVVSGEDDDANEAIKPPKPETRANNVVKDCQPPSPPLSPQKVTEEMEEQLEKLLSRDKEYKEKVFDFINKSLSKDRILDIPFAQYETIYRKTLKHFEEKEKKND